MKRKAGEAFSGVDSQEEPGVQIGETFLLDAKDAAEEGNYIRGSTVLPVAEALPDDGIPTDGLEFLLMVRNEAASRPRVKVALANPYAQPDPPHSAATDPPALPGRPSQSWKDAFLKKFATMRQSMGPENQEAPNVLEDHFYPLPGKDEPAWKSYIHGRTITTKHEPSNSGADLELEAKQELARLKAQSKQPTRDLVKHIDTPLIIDVLSYFDLWMQGSLESNFPSTMLVPRAMRKSGPSQARTSNPQPVGGAGSSKEVLSAFSSSWLLALLASLDLLLDADDISTLRTLGKTCLRVIRELPSAKGTSPESAKEQQARAWMVVAVISEVWGQRDLWGF